MLPKLALLLLLASETLFASRCGFAISRAVQVARYSLGVLPPQTYRVFRPLDERDTALTSRSLQFLIDSKTKAPVPIEVASLEIYAGDRLLWADFEDGGLNSVQSWPLFYRAYQALLQPLLRTGRLGNITRVIHRHNHDYAQWKLPLTIPLTRFFSPADRQAAMYGKAFFEAQGCKNADFEKQLIIADRGIPLEKKTFFIPASSSFLRDFHPGWRGIGTFRALEAATNHFLPLHQ